jgi:hypothetical protein
VALLSTLAVRGWSVCVLYPVPGRTAGGRHGGGREVASGIGVGLVHDPDGQVVVILVDEKLFNLAWLSMRLAWSNSRRVQLLDVLLQELELGLQGSRARPLGAPRCLIIYVVDHEVGP